jgi:hypothetical protein
VSIIVQRSGAGETVFTERRRRMVMFGVVSVTLLLPGMFIFFLFEGGLAAGILVAVILLALLSVALADMAHEALRHRNRITVTSEAITFLRWSDAFPAAPSDERANAEAGASTTTPASVSGS